MIKHSAVLNRVHREHFVFVFGLALGAAVFLFLYPITTLDVTNDGFLRTGYIEQDLLQHYVGWLFYRETPIQFPLGFSPYINYPLGSSVSFTDSIPVLAIFFRLFSDVLPDTFQYFGIYVLLSFMMQGGAAALMLSLFTKNRAVIALGTLFFVFSPIMIERAFRHVALTSHFFILFALYFYFKNKKDSYRYRWGYIVLLALATAVHPYFLPMIFAILFADLIEHCIKKREFLRPLGFLALSFVAVLTVAFSIGLFSTPSSVVDQSGYGYFQMNLNSLFNPTSNGDIKWSLFLPTHSQGLGSYEGFNYLGLGILLALPVCAVIFLIKNGIKGTASAVANHVGLAFVAVCLTIFALSTTLIINNTILIEIDLPSTIKSLCDTFRASGRMFWPVYYIGILFVVVSISGIKRERLSVLLLSLTLCIQLIDISPALLSKRESIGEVYFENPLKSTVWGQIPTAYDYLFFLEPLPGQGIYSALFAVDNDMTTNHAFGARYDLDRMQASSDAELEELMGGNIDENTVYLSNDFNKALDIAYANPTMFQPMMLVDNLYYMLLPTNPDYTPPDSYEFTEVYHELPLHILGFNDVNWTNGVLNSDKRIVAFEDTPFTQSRIENADYFTVDGAQYEILNKDYSDVGWVMVTLDIEDASILVGKNIITSSR